MKLKAKIFSAIIIVLSIIYIIDAITDMKNNQAKLSPVYQLNTTWMSKDIVFCVGSDLKCLGKLKLGSKIINVQILFGKGLDTSIFFEDYDAKVKKYV